MRVILAIALVLGGMTALPNESDARRSARARPPVYYYQAPGYYYQAPRPRYDPYAESDCERRARAEDPSGTYAGYPCWARSTFGRTPGR